VCVCVSVCVDRDEIRQRQEIGRDRADSSSAGDRREGKAHCSEHEKRGEKRGRLRLDSIDALLKEQEGYLIYMCAALSATSSSMLYSNGDLGGAGDGD
jgi:hypothetical protein